MLADMAIELGTHWDAVVVGAGAAGIFAALRAKELSPGLRVLVLERSPKPLRKVAISGGGRCNVTHACDDLDWLLSCYPRGGPRLEAILGRFMPEDTVAWFAQQGVSLKAEADGRMFPTTDSSQTIIDCLLGCAKTRGVVVRTACRVDRLKKRGEGLFELRCDDAKLLSPRVLLATGGGTQATEWLAALGHEIVADIPSLFTFMVKHPVLDGLQGVAVERTALRLSVGKERFEAEGPMLVTHWGLSGPAVLKLSAFAARALAGQGYRAQLCCDLLPELEQVEQLIANRQPEQRLTTVSPFSAIPKRLWQRLVGQAGIAEDMTWKRLPAAQRDALFQSLKGLVLTVGGKGVFKEEFVTSGGLPLHQIDPYTMESRKVQGLFVAGELLDVDGITGGFNFQNAWATGYIAGEGLGAT
jgi:predicted Rossmann fold flavoprotein